MRRKNIFDVYSYIPVDVRRSSIRVFVFMPSICVLKAIINAGMTLFSCCLSYHIIKTLKRSACMFVCENFCCHTDKQFNRKLDCWEKRIKTAFVIIPWIWLYMYYLMKHQLILNENHHLILNVLIKVHVQSFLTYYHIKLNNI